MLRLIIWLGPGELLGERTAGLGVASLDGIAGCGGTATTVVPAETYGFHSCPGASALALDQAHGPMGLALRGCCRPDVGLPLGDVPVSAASEIEATDAGVTLTGEATADREEPHVKADTTCTPDSTLAGMPAGATGELPGRASIDLGKECSCGVE